MYTHRYVHACVVHVSIEDFDNRCDTMLTIQRISCYCSIRVSEMICRLISCGPSHLKRCISVVFSPAPFSTCWARHPMAMSSAPTPLPLFTPS